MPKQDGLSAPLDQEEYLKLPPEDRFLAVVEQAVARRDKGGPRITPPLGAIVTVKDNPAKAIVIEAHVPTSNRRGVQDVRTHVILTEDGEYRAVIGTALTEV